MLGNFTEKKRIVRIILSISAIFIVPGVYGITHVDPIVQEARAKASSGDLEAATSLYHQAMQLDKENADIRREFAQVLVEANVREPHSENIEVLEVIEKGAKAVLTE